MGALWPHLNRWLTWFHRWSGVVLCLMVIAWFASGIILLYVPFPSLSQQDRLTFSEPIDGTQLSRTPAAALAEAPEAERLLLISVAGHPTYLASPPSGPPTVIAGDGSQLSPLLPPVARTVAERFGRALAVRVEGPIEYDQWIVHQQFDPYRPFYRVRLGDAAGTDLYVSARTGQVLQRTRASERAWNWYGAVLHWIYFTPLRKSWSAWNQTVWWLSLVAMLTSIAGTWLGIHRWLKVRETRRSAWSPFRGWMQWHHVAGLFSSVIVLIWIFSGWLSMDHGRLFSVGHVAQEQSSLFRGVRLQSVVAAVPPDFMRQVGTAAEIQFNAVAGKPLIAVLGGQADSGRILWLNNQATWLSNQATPPPRAIDVFLLMAALRAAWPNSGLIQSVGSGPDFYAVAESLAPTALGFTIEAADPLRVYVDPVSGRLLVVMNRSRRAYAWVYYALHTFNFPALIGHSALRQTAVLLLMLVGIAFSATGTVLGCKRLKRSFAR